MRKRHMVVWEMSQVRLKGTKSAKEMTGKDMQKGNALTGHKAIQTACLKITKKTPGPDLWNIPQTLNYTCLCFGNLFIFEFWGYHL